MKNKIIELIALLRELGQIEKTEKQDLQNLVKGTEPAYLNNFWKEGEQYQRDANMVKDTSDRVTGLWVLSKICDMKMNMELSLKTRQLFHLAVKSQYEEVNYREYPRKNKTI